MPDRKLKIEELQQLYGFSSSPLREALNRLSQEGLVSADTRRGFRVAPISYDDFADITHMRLLLDVDALRSAIAHGDVAWETNILSAFHRLERWEASLDEGPVVLNDAWSALHRDFHLSLLSGCPSPRQFAASASLFDQSERYRRFSAQYRTVPRSKKREHNKLMEATLARDAEAACGLLTDHINGTLRNVGAALARYAVADA
jgi:DNA-binding GntR family transcriptional regulator